MKRLTEEHLPAIQAALERGDSYRVIGEAIGVSKDTVNAFVRKRLPDHKRQPGNTNQDAAVVDLDEKPTEVELLKAELAQHRSRSRKLRSVDVQAELLLEEARNAAVPLESLYEPPEDAEGEGHPHAHVLLLSDLHTGEVVDLEAMDGLGEYDFEALTRRMGQIHQALCSFQNNRPYPIDELHIWLLGDMVGGKHHQELGETNEFSVTEQCFRTGKLLAEWIAPLTEAYPRIKVTGIAGNHSRINQKPAAKQVFDSFDWLAFKYAEAVLANYPTVEHNYPRSGNAVATVAGKTVLLTHGDGIKSSMPGVPWGGVTRRFNELRKTYAQKGVLLDYLAIGHWHQLNVVRGIFMNGSVKGPDEWVLKNFGTADPPEQLLLTFDKTAQRLTDASFITLT